MITKHTSISPNGADEISKNNSNNLSLEEVLEQRISRRTVLKGSLAYAVGSFMGLSLSGCTSSNQPAVPTTTSLPKPLKLNFTSVPKNLNDIITIPENYNFDVLYSLGDPLNSMASPYKNDGTDSAESFLHRAGDHHDGMSFFGLDFNGARNSQNSNQGLLCMNHENITWIFLHTPQEVSNVQIDEKEESIISSRPNHMIDKEVNAHGVSVFEIARTEAKYSINKKSIFNKRYTASSIIELSGPARGDEQFFTKFSKNGKQTRGTLNNCANGYTPWGTYLTCEENWAGYYKKPASITLSGKEKIAHERYFGSSKTPFLGTYNWATPSDVADDKDGLYARWDITPSGASATDDFRNAANTMGWVVEINPYSPNSTPRKRTAMGRMGHEGAMPAKFENGKSLVYYMGDDARGEYIYKYVSNKPWDEADGSKCSLDMGDKYLDDGKLYVAKFNNDGTGEWIELNISNPLIANYATYKFTNQADVLINTRIAADAVGATHMDRPEWTGVHPTTGDIYVTLTNNKNRDGVKLPLDSANPRSYEDTKGTKTNKGNVNGHILRIKEEDSNPSAISLQWDIYLFGAQSDADENSINISGLTDENDFSSPDGLWFSSVNPGLMWLQTDDGAYTDVTNCMMLAAIPGNYGDGATVEIENKNLPTITTNAGKYASTSNLKRFLVGPKGGEITGITETPDGKALFVNIQHPGENTNNEDLANPSKFESHWPNGGDARPRSSTIIITKKDGGRVGL